MSDLISRSEVIDLLYKTFDEYRIATDKTSTLGGFGSEVFKRVMGMLTVYDIDKVVDELKELKAYAVYEDINADTKWLDKAIEIVKQGGVSDDVCEWKLEETNGIAWHCNDKCTTYNQVYIKDLKITLEDFECKCPYCGKKIQVVDR